MNNVDNAVACFKEGFNCSQAILSTYGPEFGLARETALKLASSFGSGMRMAQTCGAVTGALMAIGLKYGHIHSADKKSRERTYRLVEQFIEKFKSRNGSVVCRELLGCDVCTPDGYNTAIEKGLFRNFCPKMVQDAAEILEEIVLD
jgi:C_GCAxxG_C_C family probable redox protein